MLRLTELAHRLCRQVLNEGDCAIDATVGNGHDTLFLAETVGPSGRVYGFDIQPDALELTRRKLDSTDGECVTLVAGSHAEMNDLIPAERHGRVKLVMFNLGYLPGGNKTITTQQDTTLAALAAACRLLAPDGLISIVAYPGHPGGAEETAAVETCLQQKKNEGWHVKKLNAAQDNENAPRLFLLSKSPHLPPDPRSLTPDP